MYHKINQVVLSLQVFRPNTVFIFSTHATCTVHRILRDLSTQIISGENRSLIKDGIYMRQTLGCALTWCRSDVKSNFFILCPAKFQVRCETPTNVRGCDNVRAYFALQRKRRVRYIPRIINNV